MWVLAQTLWGAPRPPPWIPHCSVQPCPPAPHWCQWSSPKHTAPPWARGRAGRTPPPPACLGAGCWPGRRRAGYRPHCPGHAAPWKPACLPCVLGAGLKPVPFGSEAGPPQAWGSCVHSGEAGRTAWVPRGLRHQCFPGKGARARGAEAAPRACSRVPSGWGPGAPSVPPGQCCTHIAEPRSARGAVGSGQCPGPHISAACRDPCSPPTTAPAWVFKNPPCGPASWHSSCPGHPTWPSHPAWCRWHSTDHWGSTCCPS